MHRTTQADDHVSIGSQVIHGGRAMQHKQKDARQPGFFPGPLRLLRED